MMIAAGEKFKTFYRSRFLIIRQNVNMVAYGKTNSALTPVKTLATEARYCHCTIMEDAFYFKYLEAITDNICMAKQQLNGTNRFWILQASHQSASPNHGVGTYVLLGGWGVYATS